jgi:modulator of FtsH protease HflC
MSQDNQGGGGPWGGGGGSQGSEGEEEARRIRSRSDRDATVIVAEANRDGERLRGEGDAQRSAIYADAFGRDADFYSFYRSMQAYEVALDGKDTRLVLSPGSEFFRFFGNLSGTGMMAPTVPQQDGGNGVAQAADDAMR